MKIQIVVTDKKRGKIVIPISEENAHNLLDISFMLGNGDEYKTLKLNYCDKTWRWFCNTMEYLSDIRGDGKCYKIKEGVNPKKPLTKKDFVFNGDRSYLRRKPKWKK